MEPVEEIETVREAFACLGVEATPDALAECVRICRDRGLEAETLVEAWVAWSVSAMGGAAPTVDKLRQLERREFSKEAAPASGGGASGATLPVYNAGTSADLDANDVLSNYLSTTPKRIQVERNTAVAQASVELSPATYSKVAHSTKYAARSNAGSVELSYGEEAALRDIDKPVGSNNVLNLNIAQVPNEDGVAYGIEAMFGFELLHDKASVVDNHIRYLSEYIMKKLDIGKTSSVQCKSQEDIYVAGRVECDADARLNPKSAVLQGTWEESLSQAVPLDLDQMKQYSLFPGQIVVAKGTNPRGERFVAKEFYMDATLPIADHNTNTTNTFRGTMTILVTSGPYTPSDSMTYEPLKDFVSYVHTHKPHVVIMTGPFLDSEHSMVKDNSMAETYKSFFDKLLDSIADINTGCPSTRIVIVSSLRDVFHVNIYPTPAYRSRRKHANVTFVPDPCTLNISGLVVGVTSTDVLMHLSQEEIALSAGGDKLSRLAGHILTQQCYYPLWPPPPTQPCDAALWAAHAQLVRTPHLLLLPSNFRYFAKEVSGCVVVNPEHLTKGQGGGTFARLQVTVDDHTTTLSKGIGCQVIRI